MRVLFALLVASFIAATVAVPTLPDGESGKKARSGPDLLYLERSKF